MSKSEDPNFQINLLKIEINSLNQKLKPLRKIITKINKTDIRFRDSKQNLTFVQTKIMIDKAIKVRQKHRNKIKSLKRKIQNA